MSRTTPETIWLDARVTTTMKTEPDETRDLDDQVCYKRLDVVRDMLRKTRDDLAAQIPDEYIVQLTAVQIRVGDMVDAELVALTNFGRIFKAIDKPAAGFGEGTVREWIRIDGPDLGAGS